VLGAAFLAGLGAGVWSSLDELRDVWQLDRRFEPRMDPATRARLLLAWREAVARSRGWARIVDPVQDRTVSTVSTVSTAPADGMTT
jgi:hypothetical protein